MPSCGGAKSTLPSPHHKDRDRKCLPVLAASTSLNFTRSRVPAAGTRGVPRGVRQPRESRQRSSKQTQATQQTRQQGRWNSLRAFPRFGLSDPRRPTDRPAVRRRLRAGSSPAGPPAQKSPERGARRDDKGIMGRSSRGSWRGTGDSRCGQEKVRFW